MTINGYIRLLQKLQYARWQSKLPRSSASTPVFSHPVDMKKAWITQVFGANPQYYTPMKGHDGIDYGLNVGSNVFSPVAEMEVTNLILAKTGYGRNARTIDEFGHRYIFGHLHEFLCEEKQVIKRGEIFALSGGDLADPYHGYSTGPHLHWEWRPIWAVITNGYGGAENQQPFITGNAVPIPAPIPEPLYYMVVVADNLRIRTSPSLAGTTIEFFKKGDVVPVYGEYLDGRKWIKITPYSDRYACAKENNTQFMELRK